MFEVTSKTPFWQTDYLKVIGKMSAAELANEVLELADTLVIGGTELERWYFRAASDLLLGKTQRIEERLEVWESFRDTTKKRMDEDWPYFSDRDD